MDKLTCHLWLAIDEAGNWLARGGGVGDEFDGRDQSLPVGELFRQHGLGDDERRVEWHEVVVEVPVPVASVLMGRLF